MAYSEPKLHVADWVVFFSMMVFSLSIGVYFSRAGGKQKSTAEYLLGNRKMGLIPVTLSLTVSYISTLTLVGNPAEMYAFGAQMWVGNLGVVMGAALACWVFVPIFYGTNLTSVNEYLELRFKSRWVKYFGTFCQVASMVFYTSSVYFGPSTAIEAVSGFPVWASIIIISFVSILYTAIGGIKAVIWTDVFQSAIMLAGLIAVILQAAIRIQGGPGVISTLKKWDRATLFDFDPDPLKRMNFYGNLFGNGLTWMGIYGYYQAGVQRYVSLPKKKKVPTATLR